MAPAQLDAGTTGTSEDSPRKLGSGATLSKGISSSSCLLPGLWTGSFPSTNKCGHTVLTFVPLFFLPAFPFPLLIQTHWHPFSVSFLYLLLCLQSNAICFLLPLPLKTAFTKVINRILIAESNDDIFICILQSVRLLPIPFFCPDTLFFLASHYKAASGFSVTHMALLSGR